VRPAPPLHEGAKGKAGGIAVFPSSGHAYVFALVFALVDVDVCADDVPGPPLPAFVEAVVEVDVCALAAPDPGPSLVVFVDEEVDVEACAAGAVEPD
jgi:hypothetical protein